MPKEKIALITRSAPSFHQVVGVFGPCREPDFIEELTWALSGFMQDKKDTPTALKVFVMDAELFYVTDAPIIKLQRPEQYFPESESHDEGFEDLNQFPERN